MYAVEQIKEFLSPAGKLVMMNLKNEIQMLAEQIEEAEIIESVGIANRGFGGLKQYLVVLTSKRILTTDKKKVAVSYELDEINEPNMTNKMTSKELSFSCYNEKITINLQSDNFGQVLISNLENVLGINSTHQIDAEERKLVRALKPINMNIDILNGKEQLKDTGSVYKLTQTKPGEVEIQVDYHNTPETFKLVRWDRVENVQKSAMDIVGWTFIGSAFGNSGAIAGAMGANVGKDKSVATLFLKRENGEKVALVLKCDKKYLQTLSLLIVDDTDVEVPQASPAVSAADEILKFKQLLDEGILTQEEFDSKKKQLLGI